MYGSYGCSSGNNLKEKVINVELIIGGFAQGKLNYAASKYKVNEKKIWDGNIPEDFNDLSGTIIINRLHKWIRKMIDEGKNPEVIINRFIDSYNDVVIICDEIGNGIVPFEQSEREYRDITGKILIGLAGKADGVERIICGIAQKIK